MNLINWDGIFSLLIACIEFLLLVNLLVFAEKNKVNKIIFLIIILLAVYQSIEFIICNLGMDSSFTAYLAFAVISLLPPLNFLFILHISRTGSKINYFLFIPALLFTVYYLIVIEQFSVVQCTVLYATYNYPLGDLYGFFYYLPVLLSFLFLMKKKKKINSKQFSILLIAHLFIMIPVIAGFSLLYLNLPGLVKSMESILCKFAFGYAVALSIFCIRNKSEIK